MFNSRLTLESTDDITFINRALPPDTVDIIQYVEEQVAELLLDRDALSDVMYRFAENENDVLIALARKSNIEKTFFPSKTFRLRIPSAVQLWCKARRELTEHPAMIYGVHEGFHYVLLANKNNILRVFQIRASNTVLHDIEAVLERIATLLALGPDSQLNFFHFENLSDDVTGIVKRPYTNLVLMDPSPHSKAWKEVLAPWDFRLDQEVIDQDLYQNKSIVVIACLATIVGFGALWLLLFGIDSFLANLEQRNGEKWKTVQASIKEIVYLQKQTHQLVGEIMLCKMLSEKRTNRALILEQIAQSRPASVRFVDLEIHERNRRSDNSNKKMVSEELTLIRGTCPNGPIVTDWMERLTKGTMFSAVRLISLEKKEGEYLFQIECTDRTIKGQP